MSLRTFVKPCGVWCEHTIQGRGCGIYETRPEECRTFACTWLRDENLGPEWRPQKSKMVLVSDEARKRTMVYVDPAAPDAWKREPYLPRLTALMRAGLPVGRLVFIDVAGSVSMLLPDRIEELGKLDLADEVILKTIIFPHATQYEVTVKRAPNL